MKTTIEIDDQTLRRLCEVVGTKKKGEAIRQAVDMFLRENTKRGLLALMGSQVLDDTYDVRAMRKLDAHE